MGKIVVTSMSYEEAKRKKRVGELELKLKPIIGSDELSMTKAYNNMVNEAIEIGATHVFSKESREINKGKYHQKIVFGYAYGPKSTQEFKGFPLGEEEYYDSMPKPDKD